jgi:hypothetical protein
MFELRISTGKVIAITLAMLGFCYLGGLLIISSTINQGFRFSYILLAISFAALSILFYVIARLLQGVWLRISFLFFVFLIATSFFLYGGWVYFPSVTLLLLASIIPY